MRNNNKLSHLYKLFIIYVVYIYLPASSYHTAYEIQLLHLSLDSFVCQYLFYFHLKFSGNAFLLFVKEEVSFPFTTREGFFQTFPLSINLGYIFRSLKERSLHVVAYVTLCLKTMCIQVWTQRRVQLNFLPQIT